MADDVHVCQQELERADRADEFIFSRGRGAAIADSAAAADGHQWRRARLVADQTIAANAQFVMQATGPANVAYLEGSAQLNATGTVGESVDGFAIFHYNPSNQEAVVPMETRNAASYILPFDNTNGVLTGVAIENIAAQAANIP